ncbi:MFS transporter [Streptomyces albus subsp. chlorinus]|uniref:MFS transporter n=1 Tax=Streptomyces albus TaxID=1888 RepID=UPI001570CBBB|nr:MFS transporter [Streptomyces albus]NSC19950.1 MFS transporter [Streptomyces albus subsp. chlorinus]
MNIRPGPGSPCSPPHLTEAHCPSPAGAVGTAGTARPPGSATAPVRRWAVLAVLCTGLFLAGIDLTVLHVAVPALSRDLLPTSAGLLWIADVYPLAVAALLITCGTLGDRLGRRRMVLGGFAVFGAASAAAAFSGTPAQLIAARAVQGAGAAMFMASTVALIREVFTNRRERAVALGLWTSASGVGAALGPVLGGLLVDRGRWGAVFLVNLPVVLAALAAGAWLLPASRDPAPKRWDAPSAVMSAAGLATLVYGAKRAADRMAVDMASLSALACGLLLLALFVHRQRILREPLLDLSLFADPRFSVATVAALVCFGCYATLLFLVTQQSQLVNGRSALGTGVLLLPFAVAGALGAALAPWPAARWGPRWVVTAALGCFGTAFCGLALTHADGAGPGTGTLVALLVLAGFGAGVVMTLGADAITSAAPAGRAGEAGAIQETSFELGSGLGIAVFGTVLTLVYRAQLKPPGELPAATDARARHSLAAALAEARGAGPHGAPLREAAQHAYTQGFAAVGAVAAAVLAGTAALAAVQLRRR